MSTVWINGEFLAADKASLPLGDSGLMNGIGVFDTMLAIDGALQFAAVHFARLMRDAQTVMGIAPGIERLEDIATALLEKNDLIAGNARVRTCITGGVIPSPLARVTIPSVVMTATAVPENTAPIEAWIVSEFPRIAGNVLENCKRIDYTRAYAARRATEKRGGNEALVTNTLGMVVCATTSNLFIVEGNRWFTPPLNDGIIDGITRRHIITDKNATEESMLPERVLKADAVYICNSITGLRPLSSLNGKRF